MAHSAVHGSAAYTMTTPATGWPRALALAGDCSHPCEIFKVIVEVSINSGDLGYVSITSAVVGSYTRAGGSQSLGGTSEPRIVLLKFT